jgi:uncharacterized membrane protein YfcA
MAREFSGPTIPAMEYLLFAFTGICAGFLSGTLGLGGGVIIVPLLMLLLHFDQKVAQGHSLGVLVLPVALAAFSQYWANPAVRPHLNLLGILALAGAFVIGGFFGGRLANGMNVEVLRKCFAVFIALNAVYLFVKK